MIPRRQRSPGIADRPPRAATADAGTRERLLATGLDLARRDGIKSVSVRAVAAAAEVNLGSFVYHFGTRDAFVYELVDRWYAPLMAGLQLSAGSDDPLRGVLRQLGHWVAANGRFLAMLIRDAAAGEAGVRDFLATMDRRHIALLLDLIRQGQEAGRLARADPTLQLMFLMGSVVLPILMLQGQQGLGPEAFLKRLASLAGDEQAIDTRLDWALRGLAAVTEG
ncbi:TetR family transcriptional regulator [Mitsuaria sp. WAJ17]|uniref:TetR/AcrR family transcriptional regulator n=1 Tax=Mitsuaria sp. WAJ17 TaxID=2761452 RepID=UPI0016023CE8|nr:TetR family transcriptional regulator [Mitsuaria sp. WAJ17]MBB2485005.1 TetR family transcriptional regulator [Mitsuaria sp. WAJ17]